MNIFFITIPVFALIGLGYLARVYGLVPKGTGSSLSNYVYYFALPAYIILEVGSRPLKTLWDTNTVLAYSGGMIALALIMFAACKLMKFDIKFTGMMTLNVIFGSVAYVGVPLNQLAFGFESSGAVSIIIALTIALSVLWALALGITEIESSGGGVKKSGGMRALFALKKIFCNPLIIAIIIGAVLSGFSLKIPLILSNTLSFLGITAGPVALFAEGAFLHGKDFWADWKGATVLSLLKLIALPLLTFAFLLIFPTERLNAGVALLQSAMPVAATNFVFAEQYKIAPRLVAASTLISVVISFFTLSALLYFLPSIVGG